MYIYFRNRCKSLYLFEKNSKRIFHRKLTFHIKWKIKGVGNRTKFFGKDQNYAPWKINVDVWSSLEKKAHKVYVRRVHIILMCWVGLWKHTVLECFAHFPLFITNFAFVSSFLDTANSLLKQMVKRNRSFMNQQQ